MSIAYPLPHVRQHLDLYREQAAQEAGEERGLDVDDLRRHTEELISLGLGFYRQIKRASWKVQEAIEGGQLAYSLEISKDFSDLYEAWLAPYERIQECVRLLATRGIEVKSFGRYKEVASRVRLHCFQIERMLENRPAVPLRESLDAVLRAD